MASLPIPTLPVPTAQALAHSAALTSHIQQKIIGNKGWTDFASFMQMALYTPHLGYYSGGAQKFGIGGDFVTAPEISPLFAKTLARQVCQVLIETQGGGAQSDVLELGAGTGKLAVDLLLELGQLNQLPTHYYILEVSDYLRQVQRENLQKRLSADLFDRVIWLDTLPTEFVGIMIGNEVLDAIPVHLLYRQHDTWFERGVTFNDGLVNNGHVNNGFVWQDQPLQSLALQQYVQAWAVPNDYLTEVCPAAIGLINSLSACLQRGVILMLDYGFGAAEYYHPQRNQGTLMCHYQHYAHSDPLINVGLQDVTAHVNFSAIADAGVAQGLSLLGYCNQAHFLINAGLLDIMQQVSPHDIAAYAPLAAAAQKLLSPAEMGELFKVIAFGKGIQSDLIGFVQGDKRHTL
ncbi:MAG TPA: SAM-dependent methyltransferase [Methylophilus sp.]